MIANALQLTRRQVEVMTLAAGGESDKDIAAALDIEVGTVWAHLSKARDQIVVAFPHLKGGRPRPVILRYFRTVEAVAYANWQQIT